MTQRRPTFHAEYDAAETLAAFGLAQGDLLPGARVQTVSQETSPEYHALLRAFEALTGCPVLVNTSFNVRGEPIVCTPEDAYRCFAATDMDVLVLGDVMLVKDTADKATSAAARSAYLEQFQLD